MAKGYYTSYGYRGYVDGRYILFANEADYLEYLYKEEDSQ